MKWVLGNCQAIHNSDWKELEGTRIWQAQKGSELPFGVLQWHVFQFWSSVWLWNLQHGESVIVRQWWRVCELGHGMGDLSGGAKPLVHRRPAFQCLQQLIRVHPMGIKAWVGLSWSWRLIAGGQRDECSSWDLTVESLISSLVVVHLDCWAKPGFWVLVR